MKFGENYIFANTSLLLHLTRRNKAAHTETVFHNLYHIFIVNGKFQLFFFSLFEKNHKIIR